MLGPRSVLRLITSKSEIPPFSNYMNYNNESSAGIKKMLKNIDIQNFLRYNQVAFKIGDHQLSTKEEKMCIPSDKLKNLIFYENNTYIDASFIFEVDPVTEDKVNDTIRDTEIEKLCNLNKVFFSLPISIICDAIFLIDRFISKVKVKPKYMSCLTAACFQLAAISKGYNKIFLSRDNLANLFRCGASGQDLEHMQQIIEKKLSNSVPLVTIYDFLEEVDPKAAKDHYIDSLLETVLTKFLICWHRPSRVAIAILVIYYQKTQQMHLTERLYDMFKSDWDQIKYLSMRISEQYSTNSFAKSCKQSREPLVWVISQRTLSNMNFTIAPALETIVEEKD